METHLLFSVGVVLLLAAPALGQSLDGASQEALEKTQRMMTSPAQRQKFIEKDVKAKGADNMVDQLGGDSAAKEDVYKLAGDVFAELVKSTNGNGEEMQKVLNELSRNPASFKDRFTPEQLARLKAIAEQLQPQNKPK